MQEANETHPTAQAAGHSPYLLWLIWILWLPFLYPAFVELFQAHPAALVLIAYLAGITLFIAVYMWATLRNARKLLAPSPPAASSPVTVWGPLAVLMVLSLLLAPGYGRDWFDVFILTSACAAGCLRPRQAAQVIAVLALLVALILTLRLKDSNIFDIGQTAIFVIAVGVVTMVLRRTVVTDRALRAAREEIARLAVTNERLRIARDLHDLLGHNLSLIALKSELAGRLLTVAPERAATEIGDIEQVARTTLDEVREAVAAYRQPTLASEIQAAVELVAAAGIDLHYEGDERASGSLPPAIEATLAWAIREGVTNVIRHSRARRCTVRITHGADASVEIIDDGAHQPVTPALPPQGKDAISGGGGNGLRGLAERVASLGGRCEATLLPERGFRLTVVVPLAENSRGVETPGTSVSAPPERRKEAVDEEWHGRRRPG
ncbi:MAG TPA: sensor histidine kinase [Ktedonobacteraceae bacterium]